MDYGSLIRRSWQLTWRHRFLWVLGLFAASTVGSCAPTGGTGNMVQWRAGPEDFGWISPDLERPFRETVPWFVENFALIILAAVIGLLLALAFLVLSLIAQGGMARATADLALERPISGWRAWRIGLGLFWRYLVLWLLMILLSVLVALVVGGILALVFAAAASFEGAPRISFIVFGVLLALLVAIVAIPLFIAVSIAVAFAQRAIAVEDMGPLAGLEAGFRLLRDHLGESALVWLINLGLSIAAGIAVAVGVVLLLIPLGGLAAVLFVATGPSVAAIFYSVLAALVFIAGTWLLSAIANTFFWNYWTLTYLRFTGRLTEQLEVER